jgi:hypothetical protein
VVLQSPTNLPGPRSGSVAVIDSASNIWTIGGFGYAGAVNGNVVLPGFETDTQLPAEHLGDVWRLNSKTLLYTWCGSSLLSCSRSFRRSLIAKAAVHAGWLAPR